METVPPPPLVHDIGVYETVDAWWLHFADYLVTFMVVATEPHACSDDYMDWFRCVSHPYIIWHDEQDQEEQDHDELGPFTHVVACRRPRNEDQDESVSSS